MLNVKSKKYYDFNDFMGELSALCEGGIPGWDKSWEDTFDKLCSHVSSDRHNGQLIYFEPSTYLDDLDYFFDDKEDEIRAKVILEYIQTITEKVREPGSFSISLHFWW
jgi:hypothetical protein